MFRASGSNRCPPALFANVVSRSKAPPLTAMLIGSLPPIEFVIYRRSVSVIASCEGKPVSES